MDVFAFGQELLDTLDLDPVYVALWMWATKEAESAAQTARILLAYWMFYDLGTASFLSEFAGKRFYEAAFDLFNQLRRGVERRHFRGEKAREAIRFLARTFPNPAEAVDRLETCHTFAQIKNIVGGWPMFGPWISFKIADMMERIYGRKIHFDNDVLLLYREPSEAAQILADGWGLNHRQHAMELVQKHFYGTLAPPSMNRMVNIQEVETILCKWKSYRNGHYRIGKDITDIRAALRLADCETARKLLAEMPPEVEVGN